MVLGIGRTKSMSVNFVMEQMGHLSNFFVFLILVLLFLCFFFFLVFFFFFYGTATTQIYTLSLHDALPIFIYLELYNIYIYNVFALVLDTL